MYRPIWVKLVSAEAHHQIALGQCTVHFGIGVVEPDDTDGDALHQRSIAWQSPYEGAIAVINDGAQRQLCNRRCGGLLQRDGHGAAECGSAIRRHQRHADTVGAGGGVNVGRDVAKLQHVWLCRATPQHGAGMRRLDCLAQLFGKRKDHVELVGWRQGHDRLAGCRHLAGIGGDRRHHARRICQQRGVGKCIGGLVAAALSAIDPRLRLRCRAGGGVEGCPGEEAGGKELLAAGEFG